MVGGCNSDNTLVPSGVRKGKLWNTLYGLLHTIERFDRIPVRNGWARKCMVSALTVFGLNDMTARYCCQL